MPAPAACGTGHAQWEALGTSAVLRVADRGALESAREAVERELALIDKACSRFREDSELTRMNRSAGRAFSAGPVLFAALEVALRAAELTDGDVDPTVGRALELAGYDRDWRELEPAVEDRAPAHLPAPRVVLARTRPGWTGVALDHASRRVRLAPGLRIDLGATAKAWAADRAALAACEAGGCGVLVSLGGDIATAGPAPAAGWRIRVTDDHRSDAGTAGQTISIRSGGLATSSTAVRRWQHGGRAMHHIIDPATGAPVRRTWRTVSVAAATCTDANIAATAALVRAAGAPVWLESAGLPSRLLDWRGAVRAVAGWPEDAPPHAGDARAA